MCTYSIILIDSNGIGWDVFSDDSANLYSQSIGAASAPIINLQDGTVGNTYWTLGITTDGLITTTQISPPTSFSTRVELVTTTNHQVYLSVDNNGIVDLSLTGNVVSVLPLSIIRAYPTHLLVDLVANPAFSDCTRQTGANNLLWRKQNLFPYWGVYFMGQSGPVPTDPITGMINTRKAEDPQFTQFMNNALPVM